MTLSPLVFLLRHSILLGGYLVGMFLSCTPAKADYAARIFYQTDGYYITLESNSAIALSPITGTDGKDYYRVGDPITVNTYNTSYNGYTDCFGTIWGTGGRKFISPSNSFHRLFIHQPAAGTKIAGKVAYRINSNLVVTVESTIMDKWVNIYSGHCSTNLTDWDYAHVTNFYRMFPITLTFYINDRIIDGQLPIANIALAGYVNAFTVSKTAPPQTSWPFVDSSVPIWIRPSQLNVNSSCQTMTSTGQAGTVNLRHGALNALNYDSLATESVTYDCKFSTSTNVRLRLDYATDDDPQKRLPMINSQNSDNKIYSELTMTDEITGQTGKDFKIDIKDQMRTIRIRSHIQGTNAAAGDYKGSAWLIATFD